MGWPTVEIKTLDYGEIKIIAETAWELKFRINAAAKEPETVEWIEGFEKGSVFYDVGANIGGYTMIAASLGLEVYAFEPEALNYARMVQNGWVNPEFRFHPYPFGLGAGNQSTAIWLTDPVPGAASHTYEDNGKLKEQIILMALDSLDEFEIPLPDHIKIDVDGHEFEVIQGGEMTLSSPALKSVMCETSKDRSDDLAKAMLHHDLHLKERFHRSGDHYNHLFTRPA